MRKYICLIFLVPVLLLSVSGCRPSGLTDDAVRAIVREEIAAQSAGAVPEDAAAFRDAVSLEVARQLGGVTRMTVSELVITNVAGTHPVMTLKASETTDAGVIIMANSEGVLTQWIGADTAGRGVHLIYGPSKEAAHMLGVNREGSAVQLLRNAEGQPLMALGASSTGEAYGSLLIYDADGNVVIMADADGGVGDIKVAAASKLVSITAAK